MRRFSQADKENVLRTDALRLRKGKAQTCEETQTDNIRVRQVRKLQERIQ